MQWRVAMHPCSAIYLVIHPCCSCKIRQGKQMPCLKGWRLSVFFRLNCQDGCQYVNKLVEIFKSGVVIDWVRFTDDARTTRCLWYCSVHDEESNRYRPSSFHAKISVVATQYERYKTFEETKKQIVKALGNGKASTVGKWIRAYKNLHTDVKSVLSRQNLHDWCWSFFSSSVSLCFQILKPTNTTSWSQSSLDDTRQMPCPGLRRCPRHICGTIHGWWEREWKQSRNCLLKWSYAVWTWFWKRPVRTSLPPSIPHIKLPFSLRNQFSWQCVDK